MIVKGLANSAKQWLLPWAGFFLPLKPVVSIVFVVLAFLVAIRERSSEQVSWKERIKNPWLLSMVTFYLMHLIAMFWTSNLSFGLFDLQVKLSFLLFPVLFSLRSLNVVEKDRVVISFISGCVVACTILLISAVIRYSSDPFINYFFYVDFVKPLGFHPTYIAVYLSLAAIFQLERLIRFKAKFSARVLFALSILALCIALLSAKMAEITFLVGLMIVPVLAKTWYRSPGKLLIGLILYLGFALVCDFGAKNIYNRFEAVESAITTSSATNAKVSEESTVSRFRIWQNGFLLFKENWLTGTGTGDVKDEMMKVHERTGFKVGVERNYGPHNQFLQSGSALGVIGFCILIAMMYFPLRNAAFNRSIPAFLFIFLLAANLLAESMLEVQAGVVFTAFFYGIFSTETNKDLI